MKVPGVVTDINPLGRTIEFTFDDFSEYNTPSPELGDPFYSDGISKSFYTFRQGYKLRISESEDETLLGIEFNLGGLTTDANGKVQVYIPF